MDRLGGSKHSSKNMRARIGSIRSKKQAMVRWLKKGVADLIVAGHEANAYRRIEDPFKRMENAARTVRWDVHGKSSSTVYAIALLASGQSSAITGTYAGQYIMQVGFLNMKMKKWLRNLMTRSIAITPSLIVSIISGSSGVGRLIIISSMVLSFELTFALLSLLKFSSSQTKMGPHKSSIYIIVVSWILGLLRVAINIYFLSTSFVCWLIDSSLPAVANVLISIIVFPLMAVHILAVIYLTFRKETEVTFVDPLNFSHVNIESGGSFQVDGMSRSEVTPVREDRADIPLPD
ncbi:hypothetical protein ZIOFF_039581 [Zingiber officinale]|uniref:Uncharacterized protein n=1 Tax=Zingiber officinale TaxID=94328 RepID=A0A8J5GBF9_ZINOF|nr:hypothetical protein ZIOFF_039581 [Zingiber officinale]